MTREESDRRLMLLVDLLRQVPETKFTYHQWATELDLNTCGTAACALGWATTIPELGLVLRTHGDVSHAFPVVHHKNATWQPSHLGALASASLAFGISKQEADWLFRRDYGVVWDEGGHNCVDRNPSPKEVADNIETFIFERKQGTLKIPIPKWME
jgi:hypothetical protein